MFDIGWSELLLIGVVALIVVGPKELPRMLRTAGQYVGRAKSVARDFQRSMDEAAREMDVQELQDARRHLTDLKSMKVGNLGLDNDIAAPLKGMDVHASSAPKPAVKDAAPAPAPKPVETAAAPEPKPAPAAEPAPAPTAEPAEPQSQAKDA